MRSTQTNAWRSLASLWNELALRPENDADGLIRLYVVRMKQLLEANLGFAVVAGRPEPVEGDPVAGWQVFEFFPDPDQSPDNREYVEEYAENHSNITDDPTTVRIVMSSGVRAFRRADIVEGDDSGSPSRKLMERTGISDRMVGAVPVSDWAELYFGFDRTVGEPDFSDEDLQFFKDSLHGLVWAGRTVALCYGLLDGHRPFSPRERETVALLLDGHSEKQVAAELGVTKATAHQYVVAVYRKMNVRSRGELMAQWIHRGQPFRDEQ